MAPISNELHLEFLGGSRGAADPPREAFLSL